MNTNNYINNLKKEISDKESILFKYKHRKCIKNLKIVSGSLLMAVLTGSSVLLSGFVCGNSLGHPFVREISNSEYGMVSVYDSYGEQYNYRDCLSNGSSYIRFFSEDENGFRKYKELKLDLDPELILRVINKEESNELIEAFINCDYSYFDNLFNNNLYDSSITSTKDYNGRYMELSIYFDDKIEIIGMEDNFEYWLKNVCYILLSIVLIYLSQGFVFNKDKGFIKYISRVKSDCDTDININLIKQQIKEKQRDLKLIRG